jgi:hypothetical protein
MDAMDALRKAEIEDIALITERKDPGRNRVVILGVEAPAGQGARSAHTGSM